RCLRCDRDPGSSRRCAEGARLHRRSHVLYLVDLERLAGPVAAAVRGGGGGPPPRTAPSPPLAWRGGGGLPLGAQLVGPPGRDGRLLRTASALIETLRETEKGSRRSRAKIRIVPSE